MNKAIVIINEQHTLKSDQIRVLNESFDSFEEMKIPASGLTLDEIKAAALDLSDAIDEDAAIVVFASPIPAMIVELMRYSAMSHNVHCVRVFHNDSRIKRELPSGKVISVIADDGWVLV